MVKAINDKGSLGHIRRSKMIEKYTSYKYKFSIVMAIYNVEKYIEEAIESIINQSLDFKTHVQIILVNDGSSDNGEEICLRYQQLYPDNIKYIYKENGGVSSARNKGIEAAEGEYINFLDPDDKLSEGTLMRVGAYLDENYQEIDLATIPLVFFGAKTGDHPLNVKFRRTRIINIMEEPASIVLSSSSSFIKTNLVKELKFNENLRYGEDAHLINQIILQKGKYGVIKECKYLYRKREDGSSAIDNSGNTKDWYTEFLLNGPKDLMEQSKHRFNEVIQYIQYLVIYDLKWRVQAPTLKNSEMDDEEVIEFKNVIKNILAEIDDEVILKIDTKPWYKLWMLNLKHDNDMTFKLNFLQDKGRILYNDATVFKLEESTVAVQVMDIQEDILTIEGYTETLLNSELYDVVALINGNEVMGEKVIRPDKDIIALDEIILERTGFKIRINLKETKIGDIKLVLKVGRNNIRPKIWIDRGVRLYSFMDKSYFVQGKYCIVYTYNLFVVLNNNIKTHIGREFRFAQELMKKGKKKEALCRVILKLLKTLNKKKIWLFMDRVDRADDNAEHLFKYANLQKDNVTKYFILSKESSDWNRLSEIGKVIEYGSIKHKLLYLLCDKMISSHTADFARHQLGGEGIVFRNIADFDFVFLQHGITKDDVSIHLNRYHTQFKLFVTAAQEEYKSIINGNYYYDKKVVKLTGFPRYDKLVNDDKKQIFIIPTWKKDVVGPVDPVTRKRLYYPSFKESDYFKNYNDLINDDRLIQAARAHNYEILFYPHPEVYQQIDDFHKNDYVKFVPQSTSYQKLLKESSLLITDYSSIAFDFAYMKKPVIYYQWYENHYEEGYFDYETMGMGEVVKEYDKLVDLMIGYIKDDCKISDKYVNRIETFYKYTDTDNCKRVYEEIKQI